MAKSPLEIIREKCERTERAVDGYGRIITVKPLTSSQQLKIREMAGDGMNDNVTISTLTMAASVITIDQGVFGFPKDSKELDATIDALDQNGLNAVAEAFKKLNEAQGQGEPEETDDAIKNLVATDSSVAS